MDSERNAAERRAESILSAQIAVTTSELHPMRNAGANDRRYQRRFLNEVFRLGGTACYAPNTALAVFGAFVLLRSIVSGTQQMECRGCPHANGNGYLRKKSHLNRLIAENIPRETRRKI